MRLIYEPKGAAREYAPLAANLYGDAEGKCGGCGHGCIYCYCPRALHIKPERFFCSPKPKPNALKWLEKDADEMVRNGDTRRVLFGFVGDVYGPMEPGNDITRQALQIMVDRGLQFEVCTKGHGAMRDFGLLKQGGRLGVSLVWASDEFRKTFEPRASSVGERGLLVGNACVLGVETWISIEPIISAQQAIETIAWAGEWPVELRVGKINPGTISQLPPEWQAYVRALDWQAFVDELYPLLASTGKRFLIKESLHPYLQGRSATGGPTP